MIQRTPLYEEHLKLNARLVDFAGWEMPVEYKGLREEHNCVRNNVGLFDVSHMGEVFVRGENALKTLQWLTTNDVSKLEIGQAQYSILTNPDGGVVDDIIVYCLDKNKEYLVCVNASNADKDFEWMKKNNKGAEITNESSKWSQIAVQGPMAFALLDKIFHSGHKVSDIKSFHCEYFSFNGVKLLIAATGYTGEKGVEIFVPNEVAAALWSELMKKGEEFGVQAIGLGARDTLRTEMKYSLYGNEISDTTNPIEAGLGWVVKLDKGEFIGRGPIVKMKESGPKRKLIGFKMLDRGIPRHDYKLLSLEGEEVGVVTSGTMSPTLDEAIGIGYLKESFCKLDTPFFVEIRGRKVKAHVVQTPFIKR
jgi:aminomethyltransferase